MINMNNDILYIHIWIFDVFLIRILWKGEFMLKI
jgi:hypothetical protein